MELFLKHAEEMAKAPGDLIMSDVWGLAQIEGPVHEQYFYSFADANTRYSVVYFENTKDEMLRNFKRFKNFVETQTSNRLKVFHSDNGGEYVNKVFKEYCIQHGIILHLIHWLRMALLNDSTELCSNMPVS